MQHIELFPSLMAAKQLNLGATLTQLDPHVDGYHLDIMDGQFVPNITFSRDDINEIAAATRKPLCVHLMVAHQADWLDALELPPGATVIFHHEATSEPSELIKRIRRKRWSVGIALRPQSPVSVLEPLLPDLDVVLVMSVEPGFSGQQFIPHSLKKIKQLAQLKQVVHTNLIVAVDGGINHETILDVIHAGGQRLAIGSGIFGHTNPIEAIASLRRLIQA